MNPDLIAALKSLSEVGILLLACVVVALVLVWLMRDKND
jgi:hypothetical protein